MGTRKPIAGVDKLSIDGLDLPIQGNFTCHPGGVKRKAKTGENGKVHGYDTETATPFIAGTAVDTDDLDKEQLKNLTNATVTLEMANGKVFILRGAWSCNDQDHNPSDGTVPIRFEGLTGEFA